MSHLAEIHAVCVRISYRSQGLDLERVIQLDTPVRGDGSLIKLAKAQLLTEADILKVEIDEIVDSELIN